MAMMGRPIWLRFMPLAVQRALAPAMRRLLYTDPSMESSYSVFIAIFCLFLRTDSVFEVGFNCSVYFFGLLFKKDPLLCYGRRAHYSYCQVKPLP